SPSLCSCPLLCAYLLSPYTSVFVLFVVLPFPILYLRHLPRHLHSFPTRRSSDLHDAMSETLRTTGNASVCLTALREAVRAHRSIDRKSTRLNSSHVSISYAVFCLKKKKKKGSTQDRNNLSVKEHVPLDTIRIPNL